MIKRCFFSFVCLVFIVGCRQKQSKTDGQNMTSSGVYGRQGKGGVCYGGIFRWCELESYESLYPLQIQSFVSAEIVRQIYEGLVKFNPANLSVIPSLAQRWEVSSDASVYTFYLKRGVFFQDDPCFPGGKGREVNASDFKYMFELICTKSPDNLYSSLFLDLIQGASKFTKAGGLASGLSLEGVLAQNDTTLVIKLKHPSASFLYILANPYVSVLPHEAVEQYGSKVHTGTGPFMLAEEKFLAPAVVLVRNKNYHGRDRFGNRLPYLDSLSICVSNSLSENLVEFLKGNLDMIYNLPANSLKDLVEANIKNFKGQHPKYVLDRSMEMNTHYYCFPFSKKDSPFRDRRVRQAFSYAVNRQKIIDEVLRGQAYGSGINGITPPLFPGYDVKKINGYSFNPEKAMKLLSEAGYSDGKGFPAVVLEITRGGGKYVKVAIEFQKQIKEVLNVNVELLISDYKQMIHDQQFAKADIFRQAWFADYPSPESFLSLLYGRNISDESGSFSFPNAIRYRNPEYDKLYEKGIAAPTKEIAYNYFLKAEQLAMDDAPLIVLWYGENYRIVKSNVRNFPNNPMQYRDFSEVYITLPNGK